jgi:hypothetical protein
MNSRVDGVIADWIELAKLVVERERQIHKRARCSRNVGWWIQRTGFSFRSKQRLNGGDRLVADDRVDVVENERNVEGRTVNSSDGKSEPGGDNPGARRCVARPRQASIDVDGSAISCQ